MPEAVSQLLLGFLANGCKFMRDNIVADDKVEQPSQKQEHVDFSNRKLKDNGNQEAAKTLNAKHKEAGEKLESKGVLPKLSVDHSSPSKEKRAVLPDGTGVTGVETETIDGVVYLKGKAVKNQKITPGDATNSKSP